MLLLVKMQHYSLSACQIAIIRYLNHEVVVAGVARKNRQECRNREVQLLLTLNFFACGEAQTAESCEVLAVVHKAKLRGKTYACQLLRSKVVRNNLHSKVIDAVLGRNRKLTCHTRSVCLTLGDVVAIPYD